MAAKEHLMDERGGWLGKSQSIYLKYQIPADRMMDN